jgi:hypothetical protein
MTDPTSSSTVERPAAWHRRPAVWLLALFAAGLAVPLVGDLAAVAQDPLRDLAALSGGAVWAGVVLALVVGLLGAMLVRPASWIRLAVGLGPLLAFAVVGAAAAWPQLDGPQPVLPTCSSTDVSAAAEYQLSAGTYVDGAPTGRFAHGLVAGDGASALIDELAGAPIEDVGVERVDGSFARHCRALISGSQAVAVLPALAEDIGAGRMVPAELPVWRGDFDWWVSAGGALVGATFRVGGHPSDAWASHGQQGLLTIQLWPASPRALP